MNNFREYSMVRPGRLATSLGFTREEVEMLCEKHGMDIRNMERWYDGYRIGEASHIFNPYSVMRAIEDRRFRSFWTTTGAYGFSMYASTCRRCLLQFALLLLGIGACVGPWFSGFDRRCQPRRPHPRSPFHPHPDDGSAAAPPSAQNLPAARGQSMRIPELHERLSLPKNK